MKAFLGIIKRRRSLLLASAFAPVCFGMLMGGGGSPRPQSPTRSDIKTINKTTTLEIMAIKAPVDGHLIIRFRNISLKNLNGYAVTVNGARITGDISSGDRVISPGQTEDLEIPMPSAIPEVTVLAAMFADGSIEGDPVVSVELKDWRLKLKRQLAHALSILEATLETPDVDAAKVLDKLESQFSSRDPDSALDSRIAGDTLSTEIQILREKRERSGTLTQRQHLLDLKGRLERRLARLTGIVICVAMVGVGDPANHKELT